MAGVLSVDLKKQKILNIILDSIKDGLGVAEQEFCLQSKRPGDHLEHGHAKRIRIDIKRLLSEFHIEELGEDLEEGFENREEDSESSSQESDTSQDNILVNLESKITEVLNQKSSEAIDFISIRVLNMDKDTLREKIKKCVKEV